MSSKLSGIFIWSLIFQVFIISNIETFPSQLDDLALKNFREYLRIPSVHPNVNYDECVSFLKKQADSLNLPIKVFEVRPKNPVVIITWEGTEPEKPSILLNGHMDVVPVFSDEWKYPPFDAHMDEKGNIYARGSQDTKSVSIQHIEAIRRLKLSGIRFKRTVHISLVPDEELGGKNGMKPFVETQHFKNLNIGFALDEGRATSDDKFLVTYGERTIFQLWVNCTGKAGHGSTLFDNTAGEKLRIVIDRFMDFRAAEKAKLKDPKVQPGEVTSLNLDMIQGGVQVNVLPNELSVAFDIRISPGINHTKFEEMIKGWLKEAGDDVSYTIINKEPPVKNTKLDSSNIFWLAFKKACDDNGFKLDLQIRAGGSDARFLRNLGIPALGFSPMNNTPQLLHANNEYLNKDIFLKGIDIFMKILPVVANI